MWAILLVTLPTRPNAVRVRIWRAIKALGCAALRDGAYLLPVAHVARLDALAAEVREHDGVASVLALAPRDDAQQREVLAQFDRTEAYAEWRRAVSALRDELDPRVQSEPEARRRLRGLAEALQGLRDIDYYPGAAAEQAEADLLELRHAVDAAFSKGEPRPRADDGIARLEPRKFQGRRWATRARPWVDRLACAWLIRRFVDPQARFLWLRDNARAPRGVLGFDYDGARFTHVGARVSFEVIAASFGLDADRRLQRVGAIVHYLDAGGIPVPEAAGIEAVLAGLRDLHADDDDLTRAAAAMFDALYASTGAPAP